MRAKQSSSADRPNCGGAEMVPGHCSGSHRTGGRGRGQRLHAAPSSFPPPPRPSETHSHSIVHMRQSLKNDTRTTKPAHSTGDAKADFRYNSAPKILRSVARVREGPPPLSNAQDMTIENRIAGALAGMVLGDALGVPGELWPREKVRARFGHIDTFLDGPEDNIVACYFKAGHYTDDSAQAFVILKALLKAGTVPPVKVLADDLIAWVESMNGFEINLLGPSSKASLLAHSRGEDYTKYTKLSLTNGAGMRIAPVGCLVDWNDSEKLAETVARVSIVTHGTDVAIGGAAMVAQAVASGIGGRSWEEAAEDALRIWNVARAKGEPTWAASVAERFRLALSVMKDFDDDEKFSRWVYDILGTGTMTSESVSAALAVAFYCRSAERAAIMCANMGGDTDTIGAMACAICGAFEGFDALPESRSSFLETTNALDFRAMATEIARARTTFHL